MSEPDDYLARCLWCDEPATLLCDAVLGWRARLDEQGREPRIVFDSTLTCDAPMCEACATATGASHYCGPDGCEHDTIDRCPVHAASPDERGFITPAHAGIVRRSLRADVARARLVPVE